MRQNPPTQLCTSKQVEEAIAKWLTGARDRDGLRNQRLSKSMTIPVAEDNHVTATLTTEANIDRTLIVQ